MSELIYHICSADEDGLVLLSVDIDQLGSELKWEKSSSGDLFPHLYGNLLLSSVVDSEPLLLDDNGLHIFPMAIF